MLKVISLATVLLLTFAAVWLRSGIVTLEYKLNELDNKKKIVTRDAKLLAAEKARLSTMARFDGVVGQGFVIPDRVQVVYVKQANLTDAYKASFPVK